MKLKNNDNVIVNTGKYKGQKGKIIKTISKKNQVVIENLNLKTKHVRPQREGEQGSIKQIEAPIHVSNVALI